jgi:hypothetical protein
MSPESGNGASGGGAPAGREVVVVGELDVVAPPAVVVVARVVVVLGGLVVEVVGDVVVVLGGAVTVNLAVGFGIGWQPLLCQQAFTTWSPAAAGAVISVGCLKVPSLRTVVVVARWFASTESQ